MMRSKVKWVRLGDLIKGSDDRNTEGIYGVETVRGLSTNKEIINTKANMDGVGVSSYKLLPPHHFAFVPDTSRRGDKMSLGYNSENQTYLVSSISCVFGIKDESELIPDFLFLWLCRPEFDRYARFNSWGSAREAFSWEDMQRVMIPLPPIEEQRKIVDVWKGLRKVKEDNEKIAEPLLQLCQSYIQELKHSLPLQKIGEYLTERNERNYLDKYGEDDARGVNTQKEIQPCKRIGEKLNTYKIIHPRDIVFNANIKLTQDSEKFAIALFEEDKNCIVTNFYTVFSVDESHLLQEYLMLWLIRDEFARFVKFMSCSSVRDRFDFSELKEVAIPIPSIDTQKAIVSIYKCANEAKRIANEADKQSREICPALMQYVINA